jgi:peptide/nickel transport system permease protein
MGKYVARRLGLMAVAIVGVTLISFLISHAVPSDPIVSNLGQQASQRPEIVKAFKEKWGLDKPLYMQYLTFLENLTRGELGNSINTRRAITKDLKAFMPATMELSTFAVLLAIVIGVPLGVAAAVRRETVVDHVARLVSLVGVSIPTFWFATVSLVLFYATLHWTVGPSRLGPLIAAPPFVTGFFTVDSLLAGDFGTFRDALNHLILPGFVLGSSVMGLVTRVTRASMLDVLSQDYVRTARAKGLREAATIARHALRNALIPTVTVLGLAYGGLLSGAVMTETIFAWPGLGRYAFQSAVTNDFPAIMGVTFVIGLMYTLVNFAVDLFYGWLDPQIRYS